MIVALTRLPKSTIELTITIPWGDVKKEYDESLLELAKEVELPGFRKGKAPLNLVKESVKKDVLYEKVLGKIIPKAYTQAIREQNLKPITNPKVQVLQGNEEKDWIFKAATCEQPTVNLGNYRQKIDGLFAKEKIWVPGKDEKKKEEDSPKKEDQLQRVLDILLDEAKIDIPNMLIEEEVNRQLANLLDQTQKLGMTIEQYLSARNLAAEQLRSKYWDQAQKTLALEFILQKISEVENITVEPREIDALIDKTADPKEKEALKNQRYYLGALLLRQKTLEHLTKPLP